MRRYHLSPVRFVLALATAMLLAAWPAAASPGQPLLNELLYDGPSTDADDVFTEIVGPPGLSLAGWSLVGVNGDDGVIYRRVALVGAVIPADGVLVLATADALPELAAVRDLVALVDWQNGPDAVQLRNAADQIVDAVQYGQSTVPAGEGSPAPLAPAGSSLTRDASSTDTQDNAADFTVSSAPTPGLAGTHGGGGPDTTGAALRLTLPEQVAAPGATVTARVNYAVSTAAPGVVAIDAELLFDGSVLGVTDVAAGAGLATPHWSLAHHVCPGAAGAADTLAVSLATATDTLTGSGELLALTLLAADVEDYLWSPLDLRVVSVNADTAGGAGVGGVFSLTGSDATLVAGVGRDDTLRVTIADPDGNRQDGSVESVPYVLAVGACLDSLLAAETGAGTGVFAAALPVLYGMPACGNGVVEVSADSLVTVQYRDRLTAAGPAAVLTQNLAVGWGAGARLEATRLVQAGDSLRVQLRAARANRDPGAVETIGLRATNTSTQETELTAVVEAGPDDSLFVGLFPMVAAAASSGDGRLGASPGDTLLITLADTGSGVTLTARTVAVRPFGDVDGNGLIQAFDASRVLAHALTPGLVAADSLAANLDCLAPDGPITPLDAALILQYRVRLLRRFPVQTAESRNQPWWQAAARPAPGRPRLAWQSEPERLTLFLDDRAGLVAGDLFLEGVTGRIELPADLDGFLVATQRRGTGLRVVLAGPRPVHGPGEVFSVVPDSPPQALPRVTGSFDDGRIVLDGFVAQTGALPVHDRVLATFPNPFNASTQVGYRVADDGPVLLVVVDMLGQPVRTLVRGYRTAGYHLVRWDGLDESGRQAATGVYLCRLEAGARRWTQPVLLVR